MTPIPYKRLCALARIADGAEIIGWCVAGLLLLMAAAWISDTLRKW